MNQLIPFINADTGEVKPIHRDFRPNVQIRDASGDTPNGGGSGCGNVTGYLDSWGTMLLPDAFKDSVKFLDEYGFLCDGHGHATNGYTEDSDLGLFTKVSEDEEGLQLDWAYHPKTKSQDARTTLQHRLDNKKKSGLSIGFFVGDGRTSPTGWTYDPDEDMPEGIDYICVNAQHFEEVLIKVSKPEFLRANLDRSKDLYCIYLFLRVHVFEVSQTLVPANEVSLIAEVRNKTKTTMAKEKEKPDKEEPSKDEPNQDDTLQACNRAFRALKNEHREHDSMTRGLHKEIEGHLAKLSGKADDDEGSKEPESEEKPKKEKPEEDKKDRGRKLFEKGGKA